MSTLEIMALVAPVLTVLVVIAAGFLMTWLDERAERRKAH